MIMMIIKGSKTSGNTRADIHLLFFGWISKSKLGTTIEVFTLTTCSSRGTKRDDLYRSGYRS